MRQLIVAYQVRAKNVGQAKKTLYEATECMGSKDRAECKGPTVVFAASWKRDSWHPSSFQESPMLNSGLFHATGAFATLQTINRGSTVQAWLEAAARHNARVQSLESSYGSYGLSAAPMLRSFSLLGKTSYLPLAEDSWLSEIRIGPLNKAENHNGVRVQGIK